MEPDMRISLHPALGQDITPSPTARFRQLGKTYKPQLLVQVLI
jgi:hypothetical protein